MTFSLFFLVFKSVNGMQPPASLDEMDSESPYHELMRRHCRKSVDSNINPIAAPNSTPRERISSLEAPILNLTPTLCNSGGYSVTKTFEPMSTEEPHIPLVDSFCKRISLSSIHVSPVQVLTPHMLPITYPDANSLNRLECNIPFAHELCNSDGNNAEYVKLSTPLAQACDRIPDSSKMVLNTCIGEKENLGVTHTPSLRTCFESRRPRECYNLSTTSPVSCHNIMKKRGLKRMRSQYTAVISDGDKVEPLASGLTGQMKSLEVNSQSRYTKRRRLCLHHNLENDQGVGDEYSLSDIVSDTCTPGLCISNSLVSDMTDSGNEVFLDVSDKEQLSHKENSIVHTPCISPPPFERYKSDMTSPEFSLSDIEWCTADSKSRSSVEHSNLRSNAVVAKKNVYFHHEACSSGSRATPNVSKNTCVFQPKGNSKSDENRRNASKLPSSDPLITSSTIRQTQVIFS